jgi:hypothetical protein
VNEAEGQQPAVESIVHELAKPVSRALAWSSVAAALGALALAARRNLYAD